MSDAITKVMEVLVGPLVKQEVDPIKKRIEQIETLVAGLTKSIEMIEKSVGNARTDVSIIKMQIDELARAGREVGESITWEK